MSGRRLVRHLAVALGLLTLVQTLTAHSLDAQARAVVGGWVLASDGTTGVGNARIELEGHGSTLTTEQGAFRFDNVTVGAYRLRIDAFGFASVSRVLIVEGDLVESFVLDVAPFILDSIVVEARSIELEGRVRDPVDDISLVDVDVFSTQQPATQTRPNGNFSLDVYEGVPVGLSIRSFGYQPLDTVITPMEDDDRHIFHLRPDSTALRLIDSQIARIEERSGNRLAFLMRPMDRRALTRWGNMTLVDMLPRQYPFTYKRVSCMILDEEPLTPWTMESSLETILVREVERIEFLFDGAMMRVYTRRFMLKMLATGNELRRPVYVSVVIPPVCL